MGKTTSYRDPDHGFVEAVKPLRLMELVSESSLADTEVVDTISSASTGPLSTATLNPSTMVRQPRGARFASVQETLQEDN